MEEGGAFQADAKALQLSVVLSGSWKDNVFWPRGQREVDVSDKALSSFSCNIPSCFSSLAFIHRFIHSGSQQMNVIILWQAVLGADTTVNMPTDSGPKMSQEKRKGCPGAMGSQRESFHLCHELPGWGWEERISSQRKHMYTGSEAKECLARQETLRTHGGFQSRLWRPDWMKWRKRSRQ